MDPIGSMLGGEGGQQGDFLSELKIDNIDFEWVKSQTKISFLKKAIKLIEQDGDYYPELKRAVEARILEVDPKQARKKFDNNINQEDKQKLQKDIYSWEDEVHKKEKERIQRQDHSEVFGNSNDEVFIEEINKKRAENEKNKGNEAMKSKDFDEAIQYYSKSIEYNPTLAASYCNRALVYLKTKKYDLCIKDCNKAIAFDHNYVKAYHRRGKANSALKNYSEAYQDFRLIMDKEPDNADVNADLQDVINTLKKEGKGPEQGFKRVQIIEDDDEDEEEEDEQEEEEEQQENVEYQQDHQDNSSLVTKKEFDKISAKIEEKKNKATKMMKDMGLFEQANVILKKCLEDMEELGPHREENGEKEYQIVRCSYMNNISLCYKQQDLNSEVVKYASLVIDQSQHLVTDVLVKAYLRRGLSLEKIGKFRSAKYDFVSVKELQPGNLQASQGLQRTTPHIDEEKEENTIQYKAKMLKQKQEQEIQRHQESKKNKVVIEEETQQQQGQKMVVKEEEQEQQQQSQQTSSVTELQTLEQLQEFKKQANKVFQSNDLEKAFKMFCEAVAVLESKTYRKQIKDSESEASKLYVQFMNNRALCELKQEKFLNAIKTTDKVLNIDHQNAKAIYRNACASKSYADLLLKENENDLNLENLKQISGYYEDARKEMQRLSKIEKTQKVANELNDIVKLSVQIKIQLRERESEANNSNKSDKKQNKNTEQNEQQQQKPQKNSDKIDNQYLDEVAKSAVDTILDNLINGDVLADNPTTFEKNISSFKKNQDRLFEFLRKFQSNDIEKIYKKKDIPPDQLMQIIRSIKLNGVEMNKEKCVDLIQGLVKTNKFNLCVMCLSKKEKQEIKEVLESLEVDQSLFKQFKL